MTQGTLIPAWTARGSGTRTIVYNNSRSTGQTCRYKPAQGLYSNTIKNKFDAATKFGGIVRRLRSSHWFLAGDYR